MRSDNRNYVEQFIQQLLRRFVISGRSTRVGLLMFSKHTYRLLGFTGSYTTARIFKAIGQIRKLSGRRRLGSALYDTKKYLFNDNPQCGRRRVLVVVTAGPSMDAVRRPALTLQGAGVEIFMIGVGRVSDPSLLKIVTDSRHLFLVGFKTLNTILGTLRDRVCFSPGEITVLHISCCIVHVGIC